ncbi:unnamed protein product [Pleuronectes platessa]|uniref:Uncharacterized protein n=1 Tax=Pleuronectes platessa TaxID=8262 RepID=A0A9N7ZE40_PLEPL|nr:unnamed protein product [Pleuronectes platessa]
MIGQSHSVRSGVCRQGHPLLLDRMDNRDNTPHTYTDRMLSITSSLKGYGVMAEEFFEALVRYLERGERERSQASVKHPHIELALIPVSMCRPQQYFEIKVNVSGASVAAEMLMLDDGWLPQGHGPVLAPARGALPRRSQHKGRALT